MKHFVVLYRIESIMCPSDVPFGFRCSGDDILHAEEQCFEVYPECDVVYVEESNDYSMTLAKYFSITPEYCEA